METSTIKHVKLNASRFSATNGGPSNIKQKAKKGSKLITIDTKNMKVRKTIARASPDSRTNIGIGKFYVFC
jgi:hypothetical protein